MDIALFKPIMVDGKEVKTLTLDFDGLPTEANSRAMRFLTGRNYTPTIADTDTELNAMLAAMSAGLAPEDAWALHLKDKRRLAREAISFFLNDSTEP